MNRIGKFVHGKGIEQQGAGHEMAGESEARRGCAALELKFVPDHRSAADLHAGARVHSEIGDGDDCGKLIGLARAINSGQVERLQHDVGSIHLDIGPTAGANDCARDLNVVLDAERARAAVDAKRIG